MRKFARALLCFGVASLAPAAVINVEFKFAPFTGDPAKEQEVTAVPGKARVFINNVPFADQQLTAEKIPVSDEHEVAPAVWAPMNSAGPIVRKGKNKIRIEFTPDDPKQIYRAQFRWAEVTDAVTEEAAPDAAPAPALPREQADDRKAVEGKVVFEREFTSDFALDLPWHHYPVVSSLTEEDKQKIVALLKTRADWFKPDFGELYKALEENESLKVEDVRRAQCLEAVYKAGVRVAAPQVGDLDFTTTSGPEVVVTKKEGSLFGLDEKTFAQIKDDETQMCAGLALSMVYPGKMMAVRKPDGAWEIVY
ncbi:MAG: hypothetical protein ACR2G0_01950 [Chthoniobacterales bacterium]